MYNFDLIFQLLCIEGDKQVSIAGRNILEKISIKAFKLNLCFETL